MEPLADHGASVEARVRTPLGLPARSHILSCSGSYALGALVWILVRGGDLFEAVNIVQKNLEGHQDHEETSEALAQGVTLAGQVTPEMLQTLGGGWTGHEALAISVCAALSASDIGSGLLLAVNHSGDSDSTGSICGNLLGAAMGDLQLPTSWLAELEGREAMETLCEDAWRVHWPMVNCIDSGWRRTVPGLVGTLSRHLIEYRWRLAVAVSHEAPNLTSSRLDFPRLHSSHSACRFEMSSGRMPPRFCGHSG